MDEREGLRNAVTKLALDAPIAGGGSLRDIAGEVLDIAAAWLSPRGRLNSSGENASGFLEPLRELVRTGKVPAQTLLDQYRGAWNGELCRLYRETRFCIIRCM